MSTIAHIYGLCPGAHLSRSVLGVRRDAPVDAKLIVIEPHLGDLTLAEGTVVTEFGPVPVSWKRTGETVEFSLTVPAGIKARLRLPAKPEAATTLLNGKPVPGTMQSGRLEHTLGAGTYVGSYTP
jgi:alpha-L-rhamnosidase